MSCTNVIFVVFTERYVGVLFLCCEEVTHFHIAYGTDMAIAWAGQLTFDTIIFVLTVWKSYYIGKVGDRLLVDILLRDGAYSIIFLSDPTHSDVFYAGSMYFA